MPVPKQVEEAEKKADEIMQGLQGNPDEEGVPEPTPKDSEKSPAEEVKTEPEPKPKEKPTEETEPDGSVPGSDETKTDWEHKYKVLQGMLDKRNREFKDLQGALQRYQAHAGELSTLVTELQQRLESGEAATKNSPKEDDATDDSAIDFKSILSPEELELLDEAGLEEDVLGVLGRAMARVSGKAVEPVKRDVNTIRDTSTRTQQRDYRQRVEEAVPDWPQINEDPRWLNDYLGAYVQVRNASGQYVTMMRQELLDAYQQAFDARGVIAMFKEFKELVGKNGDKANPPTPKKEPLKESKDMLKNQEEIPSSSVGEVVPTVTDDKIWTNKEIGEFFANVTKGRYTPEEEKKIEAKIFAAQKEGRVRAVQ